MPRISQTDAYVRAKSVITGLRKRFPRGHVLMVSGKRYTREQLVAIFQAEVDAVEAIRETRAAYRTAVARERAVARHVRGFTQLLKLAIHNDAGPDRVVYAMFGWEIAKKPGPKTLQGKLAGARKAAATRAARAR